MPETGNTRLPGGKKAVALYAALWMVYAFFLTLLAAGIWIKAMFGRIPTEQIVFHLTVPTENSPPLYTWSAVAVAVCLCCILGLTAVGIHVVRKKVKPYLVLMFLGIFSCIFCILFLYVNFKPHRYIKYVLRDSRFIEEHYTGGEDAAVFPEQKRNVILLILEGAETTFNDERLYQDRLLPRLAEYQNNGLSFHNWTSMPGSNWTIAGITNFLFGIPLRLPIYHNDYRSSSGFLPGADSILTLFERNGYKISWLLGSSKKFSGKDILMATHTENGRMHDLSEILSAFPDLAKTESSQGWGISDRYLYDIAKTYIAEQEEPFFIIIETVDTHGPNGFLDAFAEKRYGDHRDILLNMDSMASDFLEWCKVQAFYENTTIWIIGDHLSGKPFINDSIPAAQRDLFACVVNSAQKGTSRIEKPYASFDIAPTILASAGATLKNDSFGIGVDLLSNKKTLVEQFGVVHVRNELKKKSCFYDSFYRNEF